ALREYLNHGGKLWFTGWKPTADIRNSATYPASFAAGNILYDHFKISYAELSGTTDSFKTATGLKGYPDITVDTLKYPATTWDKVFRNIEALTPAGTADTIYMMDMKNDSSSFEGRACAVRDSGKTVFFGFPLYYMDKDQAKAAAQKVMLEFGEPYVGVEGQPDDRERISDVRLFQNAPNPFAQLTIISYQLAKSGLVNLKVYNIAGQTVKTLVNGVQSGGSYDIKWDGRDDNGLKVSNGVYVYKLEAGGIKGTKKMLLLR
ncbi:MAG: FlgD immunoglobulin-like domain containing protein, partial [bacterium]|nr:FlgD immunoglobulin-like domain containing protein [bacterium]